MMLKKKKRAKKLYFLREVALGLRKNRIKMSQKENGEDFLGQKHPKL